MGHRDYCCDGCETQNFNGRRFHCLRCVNYDLCHDCYDNHVETLNHRLEHPMQLLLDHQAPELINDGQMVELIHLPNCYTCPYCALMGYTAKELIDHVVNAHRQDDAHVVCPMCAGLPGIQLVAIRNLGRHLLLNHIEHANLLDPHTPPLSHAMARLARRCRRQRHLPPPSSPSSGNQLASNRRSSARSQSSRIESEAGSSITYQLSELRRLRPEPNYNPETDPRLGQTPILAIASADAASTEAGTETATLLAPEQSDANRFLLQQWMTNEQAKYDQNVLQDSKQRQQHALFAEHLLLSMLCAEQLELPKKVSEAITATDPEPEKVEQRAVVKENKANMITRLCCKYIPSQVMMLMSLPWSRPWLSQSKMRCIQLRGVTLDESKLHATADNGQQEID